MPYEKPFLLNVYDALVGDDPDVKIIINPQKKTKKPNENEKRIFYEKKEARASVIKHFRKQNGKSEKTRDKQKRKNQNDKKMRKNVKPVTMNDTQDFLVLMLIGETALA